MEILITHGYVATLDNRGRTLKDGALFVKDGIIEDIGKTDEILRKYPKVDERINAENHLVIPGFVNTHTHMFEIFFRSLGDDMELMQWLMDVVYPVVRYAKEPEFQTSAELGCIENVKSGVTTIVDDHTQQTSEFVVDSIASVMQKVGVRGYIARGMRIFTERAKKWKMPEYLFRYSPKEEARITERLIRKWNGKKEKRVTVYPSPPNIYTAPPEMLKICKDIADKYDVPLQIHVAESKAQVKSTQEDYGMLEVELLQKSGVLSPRAQLVHSVWLTDKEIALVAKTNTNIVHCPVANMYLSDGVCPVPKLLDMGVNVALGTDGPTSNNNQDMVRVLKSAALLQKVTTLDPLSLTSESVLHMATIGGAKALAAEKQIGSLELGKKADVVLVNLLHHNLVTVHNPTASLVYAASSESIDTVIVDGEIVMRDRRMTRIDEERAIERAQTVGTKIVARSGIHPKPAKRRSR